MSKFGKRAGKAHLAGLVALLAALGNALSDNALSTVEVIGAAGSMLTAFGAVYFLPNGAEAARDTSTPEA